MVIPVFHAAKIRKILRVFYAKNAIVRIHFGVVFRVI